LSVSIVCQNCHKEAEGQEVCENCFAPLTVRENRYTLDCAVHAAFVSSTKLDAKATLPDIQAVTFHPSSWLSRTLTRSRAGIGSGVVTLLCVIVGLYFYVGHHRQQALEAELHATESFEQERYQAAATQWSSAFASYQAIYDKKGQIKSLVHVSECHIESGKFGEALVALNRAKKIQDSPEIDETLKKCQRMAAVDALEFSQELLSENIPDQAFLKAQEAIEGFTQGEGSKEQLAGAHRMAARTAAYDENFEEADKHLDQAIALLGETDENLQMGGEIGDLYKAYQKRKVADSKNQRYIPDEELDLAALASEHQEERRARYESTYRPKQRARYTSVRRTIRPKTSLGNSASYPTKNRYDDSRGGRNYSSNNSYTRRNSSYTQRNNSYTRRNNTGDYSVLRNSQLPNKPKYPTAQPKYRSSKNYSGSSYNRNSGSSNRYSGSRSYKPPKTYPSSGLVRKRL
jgi:hypothetical protein